MSDIGHVTKGDAQVETTPLRVSPPPSPAIYSARAGREQPLTYASDLPSFHCFCGRPHKASDEAIQCRCGRQWAKRPGSLGFWHDRVGGRP